MAHRKVQVGGEPLSLDVCSLCMAVWFDESELKPVFNRASVARNGEQQDEQLPLKARKQAALMDMKTREEEQKRTVGETTGVPDEGWHWLPGLLGLPVETKAPAVDDRPWGTWCMGAACVVLTVLLAGLVGLQEAAEALGFIPARWHRYGGLTILTSFSLHGGLMHMLGNIYFLYIFGDNMEDRLGTPMFIGVVAAGHAVGLLAQAVGSPHPMVPTIGASAGISSVVAFYGIMFPRAQLSFMFWFFFRPHWVHMSAPVALVLYIGFQLLGLYFQLSGFGGVAYLGHLGGLAVGAGVALWCWQVERRRRTAEWREVSKTT